MRAGNGPVEIEWHYHGSGAPVLLIHGLGYGRWGWAPLEARLADRFGVISFDNRGIGASSTPPGPYTAAEMAADAVAVLDAAKLDRANVIGTSLGGMVAQELVIGWPERVDRLVLMSTTPGATHGLPMPAETVRLMAQSTTMEPAEALRRFVINALGNDASPELVDEIVALRVANPPDPIGWAAQAAAAVAFDAGDRLGSVTHPTLTITGTEDRVVDPANTRRLAELIHGAQSASVPGGHLMFWEHPDAVTDRIIEFLI
ncbi:MAG: alpha/beta fold hydrolase [Acidimicrobiales bacterium]|nr:alpha/beta fold hydrolase [Acidimicrobiales bacterium]